MLYWDSVLPVSWILGCRTSFCVSLENASPRGRNKVELTPWHMWWGVECTQCQIKCSFAISFHSSCYKFALLVLYPWPLMALFDSSSPSQQLLFFIFTMFDLCSLCSQSQEVRQKMQNALLLVHFVKTVLWIHRSLFRASSPLTLDVALGYFLFPDMYLKGLHKNKKALNAKVCLSSEQPLKWSVTSNIYQPLWKVHLGVLHSYVLVRQGTQLLQFLKNKNKKT